MLSSTGSYGGWNTSSYGDNDLIKFTTPRPSDDYYTDITHELAATWFASPTGNQLLLVDLRFFTYSHAPMTTLRVRIGDLDTLAAEIPQLKNADGSAVARHYFMVRNPSVPEASTACLMALGLVGLGGLKAARCRRTMRLDV
jgi:hypothetical protein